ncbi:MAG: hypothetical protein R2941_12545 [Desulfobacterales bacterium]
MFSFGKFEDFDALDRLFFGVLSRKKEERSEPLRGLFEKIPYLNTSLFEPTGLEKNTFSVNGLDSEKTLPLFSQTLAK